VQAFGDMPSSSGSRRLRPRFQLSGLRLGRAAEGLRAAISISSGDESSSIVLGLLRGLRGAAAEEPASHKDSLADLLLRRERLDERPNSHVQFLVLRDLLAGAVVPGTRAREDGEGHEGTGYAHLRNEPLNLGLGCAAANAATTTAALSESTVSPSSVQ